jgi:hypothetical protein
MLTQIVVNILFHSSSVLIFLIHFSSPGNCPNVHHRAGHSWNYLLSVEGIQETIARDEVTNSRGNQTLMTMLEESSDMAGSRVQRSISEV